MEHEKNPFVVSGKIQPEYFCDRVSESRHLVKSLLNGNHLVLISPRRMGKTGLIRFCYEKPELRDNYNTFFIDILHTTSLREFTYFFGRQIYETLLPRSKKMLLAFVQTMKSLSAQFGFDPVTNMPTFNLELGDITHPELTLEEIFTYLEKTDIPSIIAFDEFQQVANYPEKNIEALLRTHIQHLSNAQFIFAGSEYHIMQEMFLSAKRPFYNSADTLELKAIDLEEYTRFVVHHMANAERTISASDIHKVYHLFRGNTYAMQKTMNEVFTLVGKGDTIDTTDLVLAINNVIDSKEALFREQLSNIPDKYKPVLYAIAQEGEVSQPTSSHFIRGHKLSSASASQSAVRQLLESGIITRLAGRYSLNEHFFCLWINRLYGKQTLAQMLESVHDIGPES